MPEVPNVSDILTWPQATFGIVLVIAILVVPQIVTIRQNAVLKRQGAVSAHELTNNSGSTVKDAVDRIETKLDTVVETQAEHAARIAVLEDPPSDGT